MIILRSFEGKVSYFELFKVGRINDNLLHCPSFKVRSVVVTTVMLIGPRPESVNLARGRLSRIPGTTVVSYFTTLPQTEHDLTSSQTFSVVRLLTPRRSRTRRCLGQSPPPWRRSAGSRRRSGSSARSLVRAGAGAPWPLPSNSETKFPPISPPTFPAPHL